MIDQFFFYLCIVFGFVWGSMIGELISYGARSFKFNSHLKTATDCCMCGADYPYQCGNHAYLSQADWHKENHRPKIR